MGLSTASQKLRNVFKTTMADYPGIMYGGDLDLCRGVSMSLSIINQHTFKHKRLLFFVGGPSKIPPYSAKASGYTAKQMGVAVDVVNFFLLENYNYCKTSLDKFVAAANNNGNSHIKHIPPASSYTEIRDALSSSPPIITRASIRQGEIALAAWKKKIANEKENKENRRKRKENPRKRKKILRCPYFYPLLFGVDLFLSCSSTYTLPLPSAFLSSFHTYT
ncbi:26S proteasome non-ATPase regulatory subunit 4 [Tanacetum coccineum]